MLLQEIEQGLTQSVQDEDALMALGVIDYEYLFTLNGKPTELCTAIAEKIIAAKPHLRARVENYIKSGGATAP